MCRSLLRVLPPARSTALLLATLAACTSETTRAPATLHFGVVQEVMRDGKTEARAALQQFASPGWYAVGAVAGLQGEILIDDGEALVARTAATVVEPAAPGDQATLLTAAQVPAWREFLVDRAIDLDELPELLLAQVPAVASATTPLPFLVEGTMTELELHVVRGSCPHAAPKPGTQPADRWSIPAGQEASVKLVGFFVRGQEGVITHHGSTLHVHAHVATPQRAMGHVDAGRLAAGVKVRVPAAR